jgi:hypothetical protein
MADGFRDRRPYGDRPYAESTQEIDAHRKPMP